MKPQTHKSPFILVENVIDIDRCTDIVLSLPRKVPDRDGKGVPLKTISFNELQEIRLMPIIDDLLDRAEPYYGFETIKVSPFSYEWMTEGYKATSPQTDSGILNEGKWLKTRDIDFNIILFLSTTKSSSMVDSMMESFGGNMEFINHNLTIKPQAGTLLMFPSNANFLYTFSDVALGNLNYIKVNITSKIPYEYDPKEFPGSISTWF